MKSRAGGSAHFLDSGPRQAAAVPVKALEDRASDGKPSPPAFLQSGVDDLPILGHEERRVISSARLMTSSGGASGFAIGSLARRTRCCSSVAILRAYI